MFAIFTHGNKGAGAAAEAQLVESPILQGFKIANATTAYYLTW